MTIRIAGVIIPEEKFISISLTYIHGIGRTSAMKICKELNIDPTIKANNLTSGQISDIRLYVETNCEVEGDLRKKVSLNIKRLIEIKSYRGLRHIRGLALRGQRTKSNGKIRKKKRNK